MIISAGKPKRIALYLSVRIYIFLADDGFSLDEIKCVCENEKIYNVTFMNIPSSLKRLS